MVSGLTSDTGERSVQVAPSSMEYSMLVMAAPPFGPSVKLRSICSFPGVVDVMTGIDGVVAGVPCADALEIPAPKLFTALTTTLYAVPFVKPVIAKDPSSTAVFS